MTSSSSTEKYRASPQATASLGLLLTAFVLAYMDRQLLGLLTEPIKRDIHLTDVQIALLQGLSLSLFMSIAALPIGRLIDTRRRLTVLMFGILGWSVMTSACGLAPGFVAFLACRIGVGIGEASVTPCAYSLIGDLFPRRRIGLAMSAYGLGPYLGSGLALILGAFVLSRLPVTGIMLPLVGLVRPWRVAFLVLGVLGVPVVLWAANFPEPPRPGPAVGHISMNEAFSYFRSNAAALTGVHLSFALAAMTFYALLAWAPAWMERSFQWSTTLVGRTLGFEVIVCGALGTLTGGIAGDVARRTGWRSARLTIMAVGAAVVAPLAFVAVKAATPQTALLALAPVFFLLTLVLGTYPAALQEITPGRMRGMQAGVGVFTFNIIGQGFGPLAVALVTDKLLRNENRLADSLSVILPLTALSCAIAAAVSLRAYAASHRREDPESPSLLVARGQGSQNP